MHIPDGFLSTSVWAAFDAISLTAVGYLSRRAKSTAANARIPLMGVMGAFVFAAQMINFPVGLGTSGHLLGGAMLAITVGPVSASLVLSVILAIQALVFQDGGILAWGANVFNMALCGVWSGYLPYYFWSKGRLRTISIFLGGFISVFLGAILALLMLKVSGAPITAAISGISIGLFGITGILEGVITVAVLGAIEKMNPTWVEGSHTDLLPVRKLLLGVAVALALVGILFASAMPGGLEKVAEKTGIAKQTIYLFETPLKDYELSLVSSSYFRQATAGLIGLGLVYAGCLLLSRLLTRQRGS